MLGFTIKKSEKEVEKGCNPYLLAKIQPQGGMSFKENFIRKGDGYEACVHTFEYQSLVSDFWLVKIMNIPGVIAMLDIASEERLDVVGAINKSMSEQSVRYETAKDNIDRIDARNQYQELERLYQEIGDGEVMKRVHLRFYVSAKTIIELEKKVKEVLEVLETNHFRGAIFLNEQEYEWDALVENFDTQKNYINKRNGKEIPALSLAGGCPYHFTKLNDPYGTIYGETETHGSVIFDLFHKDEHRKSYNGVMIGKSGSGKSTLLKKITVDVAIKGNKVRVFDVAGEFGGLVDELGGIQIALDGSEGMINPLQVYKTSDKESTSFTSHLSKLTTFYRFIAPGSSDDMMKEYENLLRDLYVQKGLWMDDKKDGNNITGLHATEYPIFSDFLALIRQELYEDFKTKKHHGRLSERKRERLEILELNIVNLVQSYGDLFDGHSSINDFSKEQVVVFSLRHLSGFREEIFRAQMFNVLNTLWDEMLRYGAPQFEAYNAGKLHSQDAVRYLVVIDEAHHIINTKKGSEHVLNFLSKFCREDRKYFAGLLHGSHSIRDYVPDGSTQQNEDAIKNLFGLSQYKFIMQQDSSDLEILRRVFDGQLTESEVAAIPNFSTGTVLLSVGTGGNIRFKVSVSAEELKMFGGGS